MQLQPVPSLLSVVFVTSVHQGLTFLLHDTTQLTNKFQVFSYAMMFGLNERWTIDSGLKDK